MNPEQEVRQKKLTRFLCQELLYEFANGGLAPQREKEMRDYIEGCRDSQREFERLKRGHAYAMRASGVRMSPALREALLNFEPQWQKQLRVWTLWSSQRGWKALPYVILVLTIASGLAVFKPWVKTRETDVMLAEQLKTEPDMVAPPTGGQPVPVPQPEKEITPPVVAANPQPAPVTPAPQAAPTPAIPSVIKKEITQNSDDKIPVAAGAATIIPPVTLPKAKPLPTPSTPTPVTEAAKSAEISENEPATAPATSRGFIMRGEIEVSDFGNTWPMIRDKITALGGKVAGNVELGWLRRPDQSYFHFSMPDANYSELELFLGTFGPVRFEREKHPRVMPEGQIRIILTVKDTNTNEGASETP